MKLFYLRHACSLAPHMLAEEMGIKLELEMMNKKDRSALLKYNPKGQVPTLVLDNGKVLTETGVILQYLADLQPEKGMIPKWGTWERYQCMEWINYVAAELHKAFGAFFTHGKELDDAAKGVYRKALEKKYAWLNSHLEDHQFLSGITYTVPDIYAFVVLNWSKGASVNLQDYPAIYRFCEQIKARPATKIAMDAEQKSPL